MLTGITVGASASLTDVISFLDGVIKSHSSHATQPMKVVREMLHWFAGSQVRNVAVSILLLLYIYVLINCCLTLYYFTSKRVLEVIW